MDPKRDLTPVEALRRPSLPPATAKLGAMTSWLVFALPTVAAAFTASHVGYWYDSGEFVSAAFRLDIAHPPGHPFAVLWMALFVRLPFGNIAFRVALSQAVALGLCSLIFAQLLNRLLIRTSVLKDAVRVVLVLGSSLLLSSAHAVFFQAQRPEVYALALLTNLWVLERATAIELELPFYQPRRMAMMGLAFGLGLANHHLLTLLLLPALAPVLAKVVREHRFKGLYPGLLMCLVGLSLYLYLPLRALGDAEFNLGNPRTWSNFWWVVSAQAYQGTHALQTTSLTHRFFEVIEVLLTDFGAFTMALSLLGIWLSWRTEVLRGPALTWTLVLVSFGGTRAFLGFVRDNPDAHGYLAMVFASLTMFVALGITAVTRVLIHGPRLSRLIVFVAILPLVGTVRNIESGLHQSGRGNMSHFDDVDLFDELRYRHLPPDALLVATTPQTTFRTLGASVVFGLEHRTLVAYPFLGYRDQGVLLAERDPQLLPLVRSLMLGEPLSAPPLLSLAANRPVYVEMDVRVPTELFGALAPDGLLYRVVDGEASRRDRILGARSRALALMDLAVHLGIQTDRSGPTALNSQTGSHTRLAELDIETRNQLLWLHYGDALFFAFFGESEIAMQSVEQGLRLAPQTAELLALRQAMIERPNQPIDIAPYRGSVTGHAGD